METSELICINGRLLPIAESGPPILGQLTGNYVYQHIHTLDHRPLHIRAHLDIAGKALADLYGQKLPFTQDDLLLTLARLLAANRRSRHSHTVGLYLFPYESATGDQQDRPDYLIRCHRTLLYRGYTLWHTRMSATVATDEHTPPGYPTDAALMTARFCRQNARRHGFDLAIHENGAGIVTGMGDAPVFCVKDRTLYTTPLAAGAPDSVMRRLICAAAVRCHLEVREIAIRTEWLGDCDEIFTADTQGLISIASLAGTNSKVYFSLMADYLGERLNDTELS